MSASVIVPLTRERFDELVALITALADYEKLSPPDAAARQRLYTDAFERTPPRFESLLALCDGVPRGYCMFFETYSSFLAKPTLFLEDIFVMPEWRGRGIGRALFRTLCRIARERGCGRMEWMVLDWNEPAHRFYHSFGAERLTQWQLYRLTENQFLVDDTQ